MTISENQDVSANREENNCVGPRNSDKLGARRKGTCGHISVQIPQSKIDTNFSATDVEYSEHSYWVESWLDEHPDFFQAYLIRKGTRSMIDSWLVSHALPPGISAITLNNVDEEELDEAERNILMSKDGSTRVKESDSVTVGSSNPNITIQNENAVGANSGVSFATNSIPVPSGTGSKVKIIVHDWKLLIDKIVDTTIPFTGEPLKHG